MNNPNGPLPVAMMLRAVRTHPRLWVTPTVGFTVAAVLFALFKPDTWEASQALTVRPAAAGAPQKDGRFADLSEMKTAQQTILELAKSPDVLRATLRATNVRSGRQPAPEPTDEHVDQLRERLTMAPPRGAEFGTTEVFYIKIKDRQRARAIALTKALCDQLERRYQELRDARARSLIDELNRAERLAERELAEATARLANFERQVGADLAELRILHSLPSGSSDIRQELVALENELRQFEAEKDRHEQLLQVLEAASRDPEQIVATPNSLLATQPALRRLKEGLVDAQLRSAELQGRMTSRHPLVRSARHAEAATRRHLHEELATAMRGVTVDVKLNADRVAELRRQLDARRERLRKLAGNRAEYANLVASAENRGQLLERARKDLADALASQAAAHSASLIGRVGVPDGGIRPVGPGRRAIVAAGASGGLLTGVGLVLLLAMPPSVAPGAATAGRPWEPAGSRRPTGFELSAAHASSTANHGHKQGLQTRTTTSSV